MSLFQCAKCGCLENTALTPCSHSTYLMNQEFKRNPKHPAFLSYKKILGLYPKQVFKNYCSACCPVWFDGQNYGVGPNPSPKADKWNGGGLWHGDFRRRFFPMGKMFTDDGGNLKHKEHPDDSDILKYEIPKPDWVQGDVGEDPTF